MRILYVSPGAEVSERTVSQDGVCEYMRREIGCESLCSCALTPEVIMWHDANAADKVLPVNGPAIRIADEFGTELLDKFRGGVIRGSVIFTGPKTSGLSEPHCARLVQIIG